MNKIAVAAVLIALLAVASAAAVACWNGQEKAEAGQPEPSGDLESLAWRFFDGAGDGNVFVSPYSLYLALGMLANGADPGSSTESRMLKALGSSDVESLNVYAAGLDPEGRFEAANMVLVDSSMLADGASVDAKFERIVSGIYGGKVAEADFSGDIDAVKAMIKEWVDARTHGMIPDYESAADSGTAVDILNVAYFKGEWEDPFDPSSTRSMKFLNDDGSASTVDMMSKTLGYGSKYYDDGKYRGLSIPYSSGASMVLILPSGDDGMGVLESWRSETVEYREGFLRNVESASYSKKVDLLLPRFEMSASYDMDDIFALLGLDFGMPFSKMVDGTVLVVDGGKQETKIKVDEKGTEAAAVTEIVMKATSFLDPEPPTEFHCDVPFVFMLTSWSDPMFIGYMGDAGGLD